MMPYLYEATAVLRPVESTFWDYKVTKCVGILADTISCKVTEERNGAFFCEFEYPKDGVHYNDIKVGCIVSAPHDHALVVEYFRIYKTAENMGDSTVTFYANHISYDLMDIIAEPKVYSEVVPSYQKIDRFMEKVFIGNHVWYQQSTPSQKDIYGGNRDYRFKISGPSTSFTYPTTQYPAQPTTMKSLLFGMEGSFLDRFGGEYDYRGDEIILKTSRGTDTGYVISYGNNLITAERDYDVSNKYNAVMPYWTGSDGVVVVYDGGLQNNEHVHIVKRNDTVGSIPLCVGMLDLSGEYASQPTDAQMLASANAYFSKNDTWTPDESITVDFIPLWQTDEYSDLEQLQAVGLCDIVTVSYPEMGIKVKKKVTKTVYDVILERYERIDLGDPRKSLAQTITGGNKGTGDTSGQFDKLVVKGNADVGGWIQAASNFWRKSADVDASQADNDISSNIYPAYVTSDANDRVLARFMAGVYTDGTISAGMTTRNYDTNGASVGEAGIWVDLDKSGNVAYRMNQPGKFREALGIKYQDVNQGNLTIGNNGYVQLTKPTSGTPIMAMVASWASQSGDTALAVARGGAAETWYLTGKAGVTVNSLVVRYLFVG